MIKIGITGIIGSGKSIVSKIFEILNIPVYNSDKEAQNLINSNKNIIESLINRYGNKIYTDGKLNKTLLSSIIFNNEDERLFVNSKVHPIVIEDFINWANSKKNQNYSAVGCESALIYESDLKKILDYIIEIKAPLNLISDRIANRDKISFSEAKKKIMLQQKQYFTSKADFIIYNDETSSLILQSISILKKLNLYEVW